VEKDAAKVCDRAYSPWPVLAFGPFLWRWVRKSFLRLQVSHTSAGTWKILPGGRNLHKLNEDLALEENFAV